MWTAIIYIFALIGFCWTAYSLNAYISKTYRQLTSKYFRIRSTKHFKEIKI